MNKQIVLVFLFFSSFVFAQKNWFKLYTDKGALAKDGVEVGNQFIADAQKLIPNLKNPLNDIRCRKVTLGGFFIVLISVRLRKNQGKIKVWNNSTHQT